ncbi:hypothetical protein FRACYDRAFT_238554 [Fragilariopsis cylindrus CCMP1102]|uniref:Uncharacterized protein n=1 Tax=Fragilariopsis cylindrus CCMP1102 TaxID=635003 RepID=A0A1E7FIX0_9STRA|nr:hypothetical protein FRACYDRAFT_238554 [Fragilariopsis cylindrus CCMP1102]|eukprot:OEU18120.1 hypothetical protein FRACYDRAFT_238554 [Fragilariopsis cylindrus CCMP1102]
MGTSKTISKTKALAMRRKGAGQINFKAKRTGKPVEVLLEQLMQHHLLAESDGDGDGDGDVDESSTTLGPSFCGILQGLDMNDRNTSWRNAWKSLSESKLIAQIKSGGGFYTSGFRLTTKGLEEASTDELKEIMAKNNTISKQPQTNDELHQRIKAKLMNQRGEQIFDLLLKYGSMSRYELAKSLGISDRGAYFSYALQQLKDLGYAENAIRDIDGKNAVNLTGKSFVNGKIETGEKSYSYSKENEVIVKISKMKKDKNAKPMKKEETINEEMESEKEKDESECNSDINNVVKSKRNLEMSNNQQQQKIKVELSEDEIIRCSNKRQRIKVE